VAVLCLGIAIAVNTVMKVGIAYVMGSATLALRTAAALAALLILGGATFAVQRLMLT